MDNLVEGEDFYYNKDGYVVLTEKYHLQRGSCCGNRCKHCPYEYCIVPKNVIKDLQDNKANNNL